MGLFKRAYIITNPINIYQGLAFEQVLYLNRLSKLINIESHYLNAILCIWRSEESVVIGRNQNPFIESNFPFLKSNNIDIARRDSGGGAVYQDKNNLNICIIAPAHHSVRLNLELMTETLYLLGKSCIIDDKNNIQFNDNKVSGSAYRYSKGIQLHHFTLLLSSNLYLLEEALNPQYDFTISSIGIDSIRTSVANLELDVTDIVQTFLDTCKMTKNNIFYYTSDQLSLQNPTLYYSELNRLQSEQWIFGRTPNTTIFLEVNKHKYKLHIKKGTLIAVSFVDNTTVWEGNINLYPSTILYTLKIETNAIIKNILYILYIQLFGG